MYFSFQLMDVKCNAVLSSDDSPWGKHDGIRVYFLVLTGNNQRELLISGREFPEPDLVDNYSFSPGTQLVLHDYPPQNAPNWLIDLIDVNEADTVWCAVIGINEGMPYVAGGGGGLSGKLGEAGIKTFLTASNTPVSLDLLDVALDQINQAPECRGVAFAYELVFSARYLFANYFQHISRTLLLNAGDASEGLQIISRPKSGSGCGTPDYEVHLRVTLEQQPSVQVDTRVVATAQGIPRSFDPKFTLCADPNDPIEIWPVFQDNEITFSTKNFFLPNETIWQVDGQTVTTASGTLTLSEEVSFPIDGAKTVEPVTVRYTASMVGTVNKLVLNTTGRDGNYWLNVRLLLKFFDNQPPMDFYDDDILVVGELVAGNQAYTDYLNCLDHFRRTVTRYARQHAWLPPGTPVEVEKVVEVERDLLQLAQVFSGQISLRTPEAPG